MGGIKRIPFFTILGIMSGLFFSGCAADGKKTAPIPGNYKKPMAQMSMRELDRVIGKLGRLYEKKPQSKEVGLGYAAALRTIGRNEQSLAVMQQVVIRHPKSRQVLADYGKALAATNNLEKALKVIRKAQRLDQPDWRLFSAEGAILDQLGKPEKARNFYRRALDIKPDEPVILSNFGMSHLLTNDLPVAERYLRKAIVQPGADSRIRQNLALVVGLQGRFEEAETIARAELQTEEAEANSKYLHKMLTQQNTWKQLKEEDGKKQG